MREFLTSKIHKAYVTKADLNYMGSITVDEELMKKANLLPYQKVLVVSNTSGARLETYLMPGKEKGEIQMNGACSHLIKVGEEILILGFSFLEKSEKPRVILVDKQNRFCQYL